MVRFMAAAFASLFLVTAARYDYLTRHLHAYLWPYLLASCFFLCVAACLQRGRRASSVGEALSSAGSCIAALSLGYLMALAWVKGPEIFARLPEAAAVAVPFTLIVAGGWEFVALTVILCVAGRFAAERGQKVTMSKI